MRVFMFFINAIYWLWAFIVPVIVLGIPALWLYARSEDNIPWTIFFLLAGVVTGIWVAERIRRKVGLSTFFGRISESPDIEDRNAKYMNEKEENN